MKIKIELTLDAALIMTTSLAHQLSEVKLTDDGKLVIPVDIGGGYRLGNPAPCGTWEVVND